MSQVATQHALTPDLFEHSAELRAEAARVIAQLKAPQLERVTQELSEAAEEVQLAWALAALELQRWSLLMSLSLQLLERDPTDDGVIGLLALSLMSLGQKEEAQVVLERAFEYVQESHPRFEALCELSSELHEALDHSLPTLNMERSEVLSPLLDEQPTMSEEAPAPLSIDQEGATQSELSFDAVRSGELTPQPLPQLTQLTQLEVELELDELPTFQDQRPFGALRSPLISEPAVSPQEASPPTLNVTELDELDEPNELREATAEGSSQLRPSHAAPTSSAAARLAAAPPSLPLPVSAAVTPSAPSAPVTPSAMRDERGAVGVGERAGGPVGEVFEAPIKPLPPILPLPPTPPPPPVESPLSQRAQSAPSPPSPPRPLSPPSPPPASLERGNPTREYLHQTPPALEPSPASAQREPVFTSASVFKPSPSPKGSPLARLGAATPTPILSHEELDGGQVEVPLHMSASKSEGLFKRLSQAVSSKKEDRERLTAPASNSSLPSSKMGPGSKIGLLTLALCVGLLMGLGAMTLKQARRLRGAQSALDGLSFEGYVKLSEELKGARSPLWSLPHMINPLLPKAARLESLSELTPMSAWVEVSRWVLFGVDEAQTSALELLQAAQREAPRSSYTLASLGLVSGTLEGHKEGASRCEAISTRSWLYGLCLGWLQLNVGDSASAYKALVLSEQLNPSALLTQTLLLRALESEGARRSVRIRDVRARFEESALILNTSSLERLLLAAPASRAWWLERELARVASKRSPHFEPLVSALLKRPSLNLCELSPMISYARETLDEALLTRLERALSQAALEGRLSQERLTQLSEELDLARGLSAPRRLPLERRDHPLLLALKAETALMGSKAISLSSHIGEARAPQLTLSALASRLEWALLEGSWRELNALSATALELAPGSPILQALRLLSVAVLRGEESALRALQANNSAQAHLTREPHALQRLAARLPIKLLRLYGLKAMGLDRRAAQLTLSLQRAPSSADEALRLEMTLCELGGARLTLSAQRLSCEVLLKRAPWRLDAQLRYALSIEELNPSSGGNTRLSALASAWPSEAPAPLARAQLRASSLEALSALPLSDDLSYSRYRDAMLALLSGEPMRALQSLNTLKHLTRFEEAQRAELSALLDQRAQPLVALEARGVASSSFKAWLWRVSRSKKSSRRAYRAQPPQLFASSASSPLELRLLKELTALVSCFAVEGSLDAHHNAPLTAWREPLRSASPPQRCSAALDDHLRRPQLAQDTPSYALSALASLYLSVGQLDQAREVWREALRRDPINALEAQLALGLLALREGRPKAASVSWEALLKEQSPLSEALTALVSR